MGILFFSLFPLFGAVQLLDPLGLFRTAVCALGFWIRFQRKMRIFAVIWQQPLGLNLWRLDGLLQEVLDRSPVLLESGPPWGGGF